jgi:hypothetical protein
MRDEEQRQTRVKPPPTHAPGNKGATTAVSSANLTPTNPHRIAGRASCAPATATARYRCGRSFAGVPNDHAASPGGHCGNHSVPPKSRRDLSQSAKALVRRPSRSFASRSLDPDPDRSAIWRDHPMGRCGHTG